MRRKRLGRPAALDEGGSDAQARVGIVLAGAVGDKRPEPLGIVVAILQVLVRALGFGELAGEAGLAGGAGLIHGGEQVLPFRGEPGDRVGGEFPGKVGGEHGWPRRESWRREVRFRRQSGVGLPGKLEVCLRQAARRGVPAGRRFFGQPPWLDWPWSDRLAALTIPVTAVVAPHGAAIGEAITRRAEDAEIVVASPRLTPIAASSQSVEALLRMLDRLD